MRNIMNARACLCLSIASILVMLVATTVGLLAGVLPAWRAARAEIVVALRSV